MDLVHEIRAGDIPDQPVAPPYLVWEKGPPPRHQIRARKPQPTRPGGAIAGMPLAPVPGQLAKRRFAVHQVQAFGGDALRQTLYELHVRRRHNLEVVHSAPLCQGSAKSAKHFAAPPAAVNSHPPELHFRAVNSVNVY